MLDVVCMLWRRPDREVASLKKRYGSAEVEALRIMLDRRTGGDARLICVTNLPDEARAAHDIILMPDRVASLPSQYPKLWLFSSAFAERVGPGRRLLFTDLDVAFTGDPRSLLVDAGPLRFRSNYADPAEAPTARKRLFVSSADIASRRTPLFSTSLMVLTTGQHPEVWTSFRIRRARRIVGWTGTDQKWVNWVLGPTAPRWPKDARFFNIGDAVKDGSAPGPESVVVTCSHRLTPWDPELRDRLPWLADAYPVS